MNFLEAKNKLREIAGDKYISLMYEISEFGEGRMESGCRLYIDGKGSEEGETWEIAFAKLDKCLNPDKYPVIIDPIEEIKNKEEETP